MRYKYRLQSEVFLNFWIIYFDLNIKRQKLYLEMNLYFRLAIWIFWFLETIIHHFAHIERVVAHSHGAGIDHDKHDHGEY